MNCRYQVIISLFRPGFIKLRCPHCKMDIKTFAVSDQSWKLALNLF